MMLPHVVYLENGLFHTGDCPDLTEQTFPYDETAALRDFPRARWHACTWIPPEANDHAAFVAFDRIEQAMERLR